MCQQVSSFFYFVVVRASVESIRELWSTRSENIKTELWESRKHKGIVMKSIRNKKEGARKRAKAGEKSGMEDSGLCDWVSEK